ncbi:MAG: hypothetical protein DFNUSKGM_000750, partial [Candidatus Fervidibacter sacchari]
KECGTVSVFVARVSIGEVLTDVTEG